MKNVVKTFFNVLFLEAMSFGSRIIKFEIWNLKKLNLNYYIFFLYRYPFSWLSQQALLPKFESTKLQQ